METRIDRIFKTAKDKNFIKLCAKTAKEIGITAEEWADSKKKIAFILLMAKLSTDVEETYKKWKKK
jgi:hypothetical protein